MAEPLETYQERAYRALLAREATYQREIAAVWRSTLDDMRVQMSKLYEKYAKDGILSKADMTRYNRLATAEKQLLKTVTPATRKALRTIDRLRPEQYQEAFFRTAWAIDNASGLRLTWGTLNRDQILEVLDNAFYETAKWQYGTQGRAGVIRALNNGLAAGKPYNRMIADLKDYVNVQNWQALRILQTEGQTAVNAGINDTYLRAAELGIETQVVWVATLDDRTRDMHGSADGQIRGADGNFTVGGEQTPYPGWEGLSAANRINCRCSTRAEIEGYSPQLRRSREDGVIPYQTYDQWKA